MATETKEKMSLGKSGSKGLRTIFSQHTTNSLSGRQSDASDQKDESTGADSFFNWRDSSVGKGSIVDFSTRFSCRTSIAKNMQQQKGNTRDRGFVYEMSADKTNLDEFKDSDVKVIAIDDIEA